MSEGDHGQPTNTFLQRWRDFGTRQLLSLAFFTGIVLGLSELLFGLLIGKDIIDSIWPHAVRSLSWTMYLRDSMGTVWILLILTTSMALLCAKLRQFESYRNRVEAVGIMIIGVVISWIVLHLVMDIFYLRGAFLLLPFLYGYILISLLIGIFGLPGLRQTTSSALSWSRLVHIGGVFLAAWLVMPGIPAIIGMAPSPPKQPQFGYGATPGPYQTSYQTFSYPMPDEVEAIRGPTEASIEFSIYLSLPLIPESLNVSSIPLAIMLHGFGYPDYDAYSAWVDHLTAKGMAVAFIQYPSDLWPKGVENHQEVIEAGTSNFLQHDYRNLAIRSAMATLRSGINPPTQWDFITNQLHNITIDASHLWVGGHSLGAAYSLLVLDEVLTYQWGNESLVIDLEAPANRPVQTQLQPSLGGLPNHTIVQIMVSEDDMSVGICPGAFHQALFPQPLKMNDVLLIRSDKYGFPRLVASHYLQTDPAHDSLSDFGFYRRLDAQADYLVAQARQDSITSAWATDYMTSDEMWLDMGDWSDGTPVLPLVRFTNALDSSQFDSCN